MMKRIFIYLILFSTLISSQAWAWDNHDGIISGDAASASASQELNADPERGDTALQCDHYCCHGSAHLAGLFSSAIVVNTPQASAFDTSCQNALISHNREPLIKPPRS